MTDGHFHIISMPADGPAIGRSTPPPPPPTCQPAIHIRMDSSQSPARGGGKGQEEQATDEGPAHTGRSQRRRG